jgi:hypothetical protein
LGLASHLHVVNDRPVVWYRLRSRFHLERISVGCRETPIKSQENSSIASSALTALFFFALASGACAEVRLTFYSHHFGTYGLGVTFPHAHVALSGTTGADAKPVKANFGFTADTISPSILWSSVEGAVVSMPDDYIAMSQPHLSLPISDEQYRSVLAVVDRWRKYPQPSYNLDSHNCVTFVKEIAIALRLPASNNVKFVRSPKEFLEDLQLRTSKTNRIVATGRPQRPNPNTQPHTNKTKTVRTGD